VSASNGITKNGAAARGAARAVADALALPSHGPLGPSSSSITIEVLDRVELVEWMRYHADPARKKRRCMLFSLGARHGEKQVTAITEGVVEARLGDSARHAQIDAIASDFDRASMAWVKHVGSTLGFLVGGHVNDDKETESHVGFPFTLTPPQGVRNNFGGGSTRPDLEGALGHAHRTIDNILGLWSEDGNKEKDRLLDELKNARLHNEELTRIRVESIERTERLADGAALREVTVEEKRLSLDIMRQLSFVLIDKGLPLLGKALGGSEGNMALELLDNMTPEQIVDLLKSIENGPPGQVERFGPFVQAAMRSLPDEKKKAIAKRMAELEARGEIIVEAGPKK
jgi:hypothetical protein